LIQSESDQIKTARNPKGSGQKPKGKASKAAVAEAIGVSKTTLIEAEQHVETAEKFPVYARVRNPHR
jgi:DNA-binding XRE family transcriptional regulator